MGRGVSLKIQKNTPLCWLRFEFRQKINWNIILYRNSTNVCRPGLRTDSVSSGYFLFYISNKSCFCGQFNFLTGIGAAIEIMPGVINPFCFEEGLDR